MRPSSSRNFWSHRAHSHNCVSNPGQEFYKNIRSLQACQHLVVSANSPRVRPPEHFLSVPFSCHLIIHSHSEPVASCSLSLPCQHKHKFLMSWNWTLGFLPANPIDTSERPIKSSSPSFKLFSILSVKANQCVLSLPSSGEDISKPPSNCYSRKITWEGLLDHIMPSSLAFLYQK